MEIITANTIGMCFGVKRAIKKLENALALHKVVYSLGSPIHNQQEINRLKALGLQVVNDISEIPENSAVFVRAHGITPDLYRRLQRKCSAAFDGTCPFVKNAQDKACKLSEEGYTVVILGDVKHPEVQAILGCVNNGDAVVINSPDELPASLKNAKCGVLSQTTQNIDVFSLLVGKIKDVVNEMKVYNTICGATLERQNSLFDLTRHVDAVIVLGGKDSANTKNLVNITKNVGMPVLWIETADEIDKEWLQGKNKVGIATGGSTPDWLIKQLITKLKEM